MRNRNKEEVDDSLLRDEGDDVGGGGGAAAVEARREKRSRHCWPWPVIDGAWALSSPPPLVPAVIHHLGLFFTYFICNIFRNFYSVNQPPPPATAVSPYRTSLIKQRPRGPSAPRRITQRAGGARRLTSPSVQSNSAGPESEGFTQACTLYAKEFRYGDPRGRVRPPRPRSV